MASGALGEADERDAEDLQLFQQRDQVLAADRDCSSSSYTGAFRDSNCPLEVVARRVLTARRSDRVIHDIPFGGSPFARQINWGRHLCRTFQVCAGYSSFHLTL